MRLGSGKKNGPHCGRGAETATLCDWGSADVGLVGAPLDFALRSKEFDRPLHKIAPSFADRGSPKNTGRPVAGEKRCETG